jgi:hypothetical protein
MASTLWIQESCNLFVGDDGPDNSKHLSLESIKLPTLEEISQEHHAGGAIGQIKVGGLGLKPLECTFKLKGWDPQTLSQFGLGKKNQLPFTVYGLIRNKNGNAALECKAIIRARLAKVEPDEFKRGDLYGHNYMLDEILHYELYFDKQEKYYWDFFGSDYRIDGVPQNDDERAILRIPGV